MRRWFTLLVAVVFLSLSLGGCAKNPVTGEQQLSLMSKQEEIRIGEKQYPIMTQMYDGTLDDRDLQQYVSRIGHQLARVSHRPDLPYEFNVVNGSVPNAYALPGGKISVTRGLVMAMEEERELAAVIGHEIGHATARHGAQRYTQQVLAGVLLTAGQIYMRTSGVEYAGLYGDLGQLGARAILASYSRSQERQADRLGILYAVRAGYDPRGMVELQKTLLNLREEKPNALETLFATHPLSEKRIAYSREEIRRVRGRVSAPEGKRLNLYQPRVVDTWHPRQPAYDAMDTGISALQEKKIRQAETSFETAIDRYPGEALFHAWLGRARMERDRDREARSSLDRAVNLNADVFRVRLFSAMNALELGNYRASLVDLDRAESLLPDFPDTKFYRGRNHEELGNRDEAAQFYKAYLRQVNRGEKAEYAYRRLEEWGYV